MSQQNPYTADILKLWDPNGAQRQLSNVAQAMFCIGIMRGVLPKVDNSGNVNTLIYTGNPCHRTYFIITQGRQSSQNALRSSRDTPTIEVLRCFNPRQRDQRDLEQFDYMLNLQKIEIYSPNSGSISYKDLVDKDISTILSNLGDNIRDDLRKYIPNKVYYIQ